MVDIMFYTENTSKMKTNFSRSSQSKGEEFIKKLTFNIKIDIKKNTKWKRMEFFTKLKHQSVSDSVQLLSRAQLFVTPWTAAHQAFLSITNSWSLLKLMSIMSVMPSNHLIFCCPLLPPSIFPSTRIFSNESVLCIRWPKYWSFSFSNSPSNEYSGLTCFRINGWDLLAVQGTLKRLLQHHSSKTSIIRCSEFFIETESPNMTHTSKHDHWKNHSFD